VDIIFKLISDTIYVTVLQCGCPVKRTLRAFRYQMLGFTMTTIFPWSLKMADINLVIKFCRKMGIIGIIVKMLSIILPLFILQLFFNYTLP